MLVGQRREAILEEWPATARAALGGLSPLESRDDTALRIPLLASVLLVEQAIADLPALVERFPTLRYRVVGKGTDKDRLIEFARATGVREHVIFEENLSDEELVQRYRDCSAFVLPSANVTSPSNRTCPAAPA